MKTENLFNLPPDYYVRVHPGMTVAVIAVMWILFPTLAFFPNALDFVVNDTVGDFIEDNRYNLIKLFNVQVWVIINVFFLSPERFFKSLAERYKIALSFHSCT